MKLFPLFLGLAVFLGCASTTDAQWRSHYRGHQYTQQRVQRHGWHQYNRHNNQHRFYSDTRLQRARTSYAHTYRVNRHYGNPRQLWVRSVHRQPQTVVRYNRHWNNNRRWDNQRWNRPNHRWNRHHCR